MVVPLTFSGSEGNQGHWFGISHTRRALHQVPDSRDKLN